MLHSTIASGDHAVGYPVRMKVDRGGKCFQLWLAIRIIAFPNGTCSAHLGSKTYVLNTHDSRGRVELAVSASMSRTDLFDRVGSSGEPILSPDRKSRSAAKASLVSNRRLSPRARGRIPHHLSRLLDRSGGLSSRARMALVTAPLQIAADDIHGENTPRYQPQKVAAMEGDWRHGAVGAGEPLACLPFRTNRESETTLR